MDRSSVDLSRKRQRAEILKLKAETRKLTAELKDSERPFLQRAALSTATPFIAAIAALVAAFVSQDIAKEKAQFVVDKAKAELELKSTGLERDQAKKDRDDFKKDRDDLKSQAGKIRQQVKELQHTRLELEQDLALSPLRVKLDEYLHEPGRMAAQGIYVEQLVETLVHDRKLQRSRLDLAASIASDADTEPDVKLLLYLTLSSADKVNKDQWDWQIAHLGGELSNRGMSLAELQGLADILVVNHKIRPAQRAEFAISILKRAKAVEKLSENLIFLQKMVTEAPDISALCPNCYIDYLTNLRDYFVMNPDYEAANLLISECAECFAVTVLSFDSEKRRTTMSSIKTARKQKWKTRLSSEAARGKDDDDWAYFSLPKDLQRAVEGKRDSSRWQEDNACLIEKWKQPDPKEFRDITVVLRITKQHSLTARDIPACNGNPNSDFERNGAERQ